MRTYKLYANANATGNNLAAVTIAKSGRIKGARWSADINSVVDNDAVMVELSFFPVAVAGVNDTSGTFDQLTITNNGTAGGSCSINRQSALDIPVGLGERLYLNATASGSPTSVRCTVFVDVEE